MVGDELRWAKRGYHSSTLHQTIEGDNGRSNTLAQGLGSTLFMRVTANDD